MREGLLWYDNDPKKALTTKVTEAAQAYQRKFGRRPDTCYVAPGAGLAAGEGPGTALRPVPLQHRWQNGTGLRLVPSTLVRPHHFWVGVDAHAPATAEKPVVADEPPAARQARPRPQPAAVAS